MTDRRKSDPAILEDTLRVLRQCDGNNVHAAKILGVSEWTVRQRRKKLAIPSCGFQRARLPDPEEPTPERWERRRRAFRRRRDHREAAAWRRFQMDHTEPCGILWFGDPHLDDDGCDFDALDRAVTVANLPGVYSVGIGDYTNNWVGKLSRLYAKQETTASQAWADVEHFVCNLGINWLTLIKGNHDLWSGAGDPLDYIARDVTELDAWRAQFVLCWPNEFELPIDAAHDHKGHSQWSESFGAKKAAYQDGRASIYVCGHKHSFSLDRFIHPRRGTKHESFRVRGFKYHDDYALVNGFDEQQGGEALLTVVDPAKGYFKTFEDLEMGVVFLEALRANHDAR